MSPMEKVPRVQDEKKQKNNLMTPLLETVHHDATDNASEVLYMVATLQGKRPVMTLQQMIPIYCNLTMSPRPS